MIGWIAGGVILAIVYEKTGTASQIWLWMLVLAVVVFINAAAAVPHETKGQSND